MRIECGSMGWVRIPKYLIIGSLQFIDQVVGDAIFD